MQIISVNVYAINESASKTINKWGFPTGSVIFRPSTQTFGAVTTYGVIQDVNGNQYATVETVAQLATLAG